MRGCPSASALSVCRNSGSLEDICRRTTQIEAARLRPFCGYCYYLLVRIPNSTGVGEKICCEFLAHSAVVNFWNQKLSDTTLESTLMRRIPLSFYFFHFLFLQVYFAKKSFWRVVSLDGKKRFVLQFLVPSSTKIRENTRALLMMVATLIFTPKKKSLVFSRSAAVRRRVHQQSDSS